ncbi:MAG: thioredoxin domain-containing protein [Bdellovibrionota bacterium]
MSEQKRLNLNLKNLLLTGIVGWITSLYTLWHRTKVLAGLDIGQSFCNLSESINCDNVALSSYSKILGISVPTYGLIFFTIVSLLAFRALRQARHSGVGELTHKLLLLTAWVGILTSLGLGLISLTQIGSLCLVCVLVYALCASLFYFVWKIKQLHAFAPFFKDTLSSGYLFVVAAFIVAQFALQPLSDFAASSSVSSEEKLPQEFLDQVMRDFSTQSSYEIPKQMSPSFGPDDAPVKIVEFSDFKCPHCAQNHKNMPPALYPFKEKIQVIYKNFPLDTACNSGGSHRNACLAARAARCVSKKMGYKSFTEMQEYLFANFESFDKESIEAEATSLGLSKSDYADCVESSEVHQEIKEEIDLGKSLGIEGTPSLFINGKFLRSGTNPAVLKEIIREELKK